MLRIKQLRYLLILLTVIPFFSFAVKRVIVLTAVKQPLLISPIAPITVSPGQANTSIITPTAFNTLSYMQGANGYAISWPQCGKKYPDPPFDFGIIGVTGGYSVNNNPCLKSEYEWAVQAKYKPSFYINMDFPQFLDKTLVATFQCRKADEYCIAYQYGYYTGNRAYNYALSQNVTGNIWWLDVQIISAWSKDKSLNAQVLLGAIAFFKKNELPVGLSTTPYQWNAVVGDLQTNLPNWIPGMTNREIAADFCKSGSSYSGGYVKQLAYIANGFEMVYACGN